MKINLEDIKQNIQKSLMQTSGTFEFAEINFHLKTILNKIEEKQLREQRKNKLETISNNMILNNGQLMTPDQAKNAITKIDRLIELEQKKLDVSQQKEIENKTLID